MKTSLPCFPLHVVVYNAKHPPEDKAIARGVFPSVGDLKAPREAFLAAWNNDPNPFVLTTTVESINEKLAFCRQILERI